MRHFSKLKPLKPSQHISIPRASIFLCRKSERNISTGKFSDEKLQSKHAKKPKKKKSDSVCRRECQMSKIITA